MRALRDPDMAKDREVLDKRWRAQIADIVRNGQQSGEFPVDDPAEDLALRLGALIDGLAVQVLMNDADVTPQRMRDVCLEVAARELGFEPEPAAKR